MHVVNVPLRVVSNGATLRDTVVRHWLPALDAHRPQLVLSSAGFDAHRDDGLAGLALVEGGARG